MTHQPRLLPGPVPFPFAPPLVMQFFTSRHAEFQLGPTLFPVQPQGNERESPPFDRPTQGVDFTLVKQQFAGPFRVDGPVRGDGGQGGDLAPEQPNGTVPDDGIAVSDLDASGPQGLDFPPFKHQSGFVALLNGIVMARPPVFNLGGAL